MTPALAFFLLAGIALVCATTAHVARLYFLDRAGARDRRELASDNEVKSLREKLDVVAKQTAEHKAILASNATRGVRK